MVTWLSWTLVALGVVLVVIAVTALAGRLRPLRRALRRLGWRREELERLQAKAEATLQQVDELAAGLTAVRRGPEAAVSQIRPPQQG